MSTGSPNLLTCHCVQVAKPVVELVHDLRAVMMPFTAPRLRERRSNTLRDFVDVAAPLGVTHLMFLSQSAANTHLRLGRLPHGPTLTFRLETYALARAVRGVQKRPVDISTAFEHPPLVVLHGFNAAASAAGSAKVPGTAGVSLADALKMTTTVLQNAFPQIQPATVKVSSCKRVVLFHYDATTGVIEFRHFHVRTAAVGLSRAVRKVAASQSSAKHLPNLAGLQDVSEFMLSGGRTGAGGAASDSEAEGDEASRVAVPGGGSSGGAGAGGSRGASQSAIKLTEIGPRMSLRLLKIEQELAKGEVLYHALQTRTIAEAAALRAAAADKERLKAERKAVQEANVARKAAEAAAKKAAKADRVAARQEAAKKAASEGRLADEDEEEEDGAGAADDDDDGDDDDDEDGGAGDADAESGDEDEDGADRAAATSRRGAAAAAVDDEEDEEEDGDDADDADDFDDEASLQSDEQEEEEEEGAAAGAAAGGAGAADSEDEEAAGSGDEEEDDDDDDDDENDDDEEEEEDGEEDEEEDDEAAAGGASASSRPAPSASSAAAAARAPAVGDKRKLANAAAAAKPAAGPAAAAKGKGAAVAAGSGRQAAAPAKSGHAAASAAAKRARR